MSTKLHDYNFGEPVTYRYPGEPIEPNEIRISPKYTSLKDELINNSIRKISIEEFIINYTKAKRYLTHPKYYEYCKRISPKYDEYGIYWTLTEDHLVALMMYCNYSDLCYKFRQTYRIIRQHIAASHSHFYFMGKYLKILVHKFGTNIKDRNITLFYHGVSKKMLLHQNIGCIRMYIPLSTTPELASALNFTEGSHGMIIQFNPCPNAKYFDVALLSRFSHESELLFVNTDLQVCDIILCQYNFYCSPFIHKLYDIHKLFHNNIMEIKNLSPQFANTMIQHQLSSHQFNDISPGAQYGTKMINKYFNNQKVINMDCDQIRNSTYKSVFKIFFYSTHEWVKIGILTALFMNLEEIILENIRLTAFMFKNIHNHIMRNEMSKIVVIEIIKIKQYNDANTIQLINSYVIKLFKLDWVLRFDNDNLLLFNRTHNTRPRIRNYAIYGRPINNIICENTISEDDVDTDEENKEFKHEYEYKYEKINGKTYVLPREYKNIGPVFEYGTKWPDDITSQYKHLQQEVLNNKYANITKKEWISIHNKCHKILNGPFLLEENKQWAKTLKTNRIRMRHLVALKLYTDYQSLQKEFGKSFRAPDNKDIQRMREFYHWRNVLKETFERFSSVESVTKQPDTVFHGINSVMCIDKYQGIYYGPYSTTTDLHQARSFAGKNGMILVIKLEPGNKGLDISWLSDFENEREYLLFNHEIDIETWLLSSDYDQYYKYYNNIFKTNNSLNKSYTNYEKQLENSKYLLQLKSMVYEKDIPSEYDIKIKQIVEFGNNMLEYKEKINLLIWIFQFALKYNSKISSKYDQSLNGNIQHIMKLVHKIQIPQELINNLKQTLHMEMSNNNIISVLNKYFVNTYCSIDIS